MVSTGLSFTGGLAGLMLAITLVVSPASSMAAGGHPLRQGKSLTGAERKFGDGDQTGTAPRTEPSDAAARLIAWVAAAHDNEALPYIVIDKQAAALFLFSANGDLRGQAPVLLGMGIGDESSPGVGAKSLADIGPAERTTPAGRFVAKFGRAFDHQRVLWVDYANSVALHAVITTHRAEHRVQRLLSPTPEDNRISFGCINVGTSFYAGQLRPLFQKAGGVVYILPEIRSLDEVFPRVRLLPYLTSTSLHNGPLSEVKH